MEVVSVREINVLADQTVKMYRHPLTVSNAILKADADIIAMHRDMKDVVLARNIEDLNIALSKVNAHEEEVYQHFDTAMDRFLGDKSKIIEVRKIFSDWAPIRLEVIILSRAGKYIEAGAITKGKGADHVVFLTTKMGALIEFANDKASSFLSKSKVSHSTSIRTLRLLMAALLIVASLVAIFVIKRVEKTEKSLRESEGITQQLLNASGEGIYGLNNKGETTFINPAACKMLGYTSDELVGKPQHEIIHHSKSDGSDYPRHECPIYAAFNDGEIHKIVDEVFWRKDGTPFPVEYTSTPILKNAELVGAVVNFSDITERINTEEVLRQSQKMEAVGHLTGGLAHDFNNLLGVIMGNAEMVEERIQGDEKAKQRIEALLSAAKRGAALTYRLLAFSRKQPLSPSSVDINDLINSLEDMLHRTLGEAIDLRVKTTPGLWSAMIDTSQLENALVNLAINARDAMPKGGSLTIETNNITLDKTYAELHVEVTPGDYIMVAVSDSGTGMTPEVLDKVFEPFFTTKDVGGGSGLGLSMVYGFVKQSKGHITIYSEIDHGTTVKLYMPRSGEEVSKISTKKDTQEFASGSERILVVEDDENVRVVPVSILQDQGYAVVEAADGKEAIKHLKDGPPFDLLFTDIVLPGGMNGVEIAEQAKQLQPNIKVLYTTGYTGNAIIHQGKLDPGVNLINKPYLRAELLERVRTLLDEQKG